MYKFITGNERAIERLINNALDELPNAEINQPLMSYITPRGVMFYILIEYGDYILEEEDGEILETDDEDEGENDGEEIPEELPPSSADDTPLVNEGGEEKDLPEDNNNDAEVQKNENKPGSDKKASRGGKNTA